MQCDLKPSLKWIDRRGFLRLSAVGAGAVGSAAAVALLCSSRTEDTGGIMDAVPVRNPAFQSVTGLPQGHRVLYCQTVTRRTLAYELNSPGQAIWQHCNSYSGDQGNIGRMVCDIADRLSDRMDIDWVVEFVELMHTKGLVYFANRASQVYFAYEGPP